MKLVVKDSEFESQVEKILEVNATINDAALQTKNVLESILEDAIVDKYINEAIDNKMRKIHSYADKLVLLSNNDKTNVSNFINYIAELDSKLD
ncbi:MAG: hypothetical protein E7272_04455 [Pseudobutyrivibrio ruminis]|uniref:Uncharacterized protein n=1 Tax=Pseudobutyrivibrio ruminis TaxID=46206 RepID=A0A927UBW0_9FIRM|nr:hypothetical protein [Pseudobutyrivibrio ruminis]